MPVTVAWVRCSTSMPESVVESVVVHVAPTPTGSVGRRGASEPRRPANWSIWPRTSVETDFGTRKLTSDSTPCASMWARPVMPTMGFGAGVSCTTAVGVRSVPAAATSTAVIFTARRLPSASASSTRYSTVSVTGGGSNVRVVAPSSWVRAMSVVIVTVVVVPATSASRIAWRGSAPGSVSVGASARGSVVVVVDDVVVIRRVVLGGVEPPSLPNRPQPESVAASSTAMATAAGRASVRPGIRATLPGGVAAHVPAVDEQDHDRADDRTEDAGRLDASLADVLAQQRVAEPATDERADHAEDRGREAALRARAADDGAGQESGEEPDDQEGEEGHRDTSGVGVPPAFPIRPRDENPLLDGDLAGHRVVDRAPVLVGARLGELHLLRRTLGDVAGVELGGAVGAGEGVGARVLVGHRDGVADLRGGGRGRELEPLDRDGALGSGAAGAARGAAVALAARGEREQQGDGHRRDAGGVTSGAHGKSPLRP